MKKFLMTLTAVFCCAMAISVLSSCSKDDKGNNDAPDTTPASAKVIFIYHFPNDMLQFIDMTAEYLDENGNVQSEKITSPAWVKDITATKLPAKLGARLHLAKKSGVDYATASKVSVGAKITRTYSILNKAGTVLKSAEEGSFSYNGNWLSGDGIVQFIEKEGKNFATLLVELDANGKETQGEWKD